MASSAERDALIESILDEALEGFEGLVPDHQLGLVRDLLGATLATHPEGRGIIRQALSDPELQRSGDVDRSADDEDAEPTLVGGGKAS